MSFIPSAIIMVNPDMGDVSLATLNSQLQIDETITISEFNARVLVDPNYPVLVHLNQLRIMVTQPDFGDFTNRNLMDIVLFVKQGLASVERNKYGAPSLTLPINRLNLFNLFAGITNQPVLTCQKCKCCCNCFKDLPQALQDMLIDKSDPSHVHDANCDNEFNNIDFINRS